MLVSFSQLIVMTDEYENWSPRINFPLNFFIRTLITMYFFAFGVGLLWYNILASVSVFLFLSMIYYIFLFSRVWKIFELSVGKFVLYLVFTIPVAIMIGYFAQKMFGIIINILI